MILCQNFSLYKHNLHTRSKAYDKKKYLFNASFCNVVVPHWLHGGERVILSKDALPSQSATALQADNTASVNENNDTTGEIGALYKGVPLLIPELDVFFIQATRIGDSIFLLGSSKDIPCLYKTDISGSQTEKIEYNGSERFYSIREGTDDSITSQY